MTKSKMSTRAISRKCQGRPMRQAEERMSLKERHRLHRLRHPNEKSIELLEKIKRSLQNRVDWEGDE